MVQGQACNMCWQQYMTGSHDQPTSFAAAASEVAPPVLDLVNHGASELALWWDDGDVLRKVPVVGPRLIPDLEAVLKV